MTNVVLVLTTIPAAGPGEDIARLLVAERLATCVSIYPPMTSFFRWHGSVDHADERQLLIKTTRDRVPAIEQRIRELHSYELPEFLVVAVGAGGVEYLAWVAEGTRPES